MSGAVVLAASDAPSIFLAFAAGLVSFVSPCVLPLVPGYLSTVCGLSPDELRSPDTAMRGVLVRASLFILTFTAIFVLLGMTATGVGRHPGGLPFHAGEGRRASRSSRWACCSCSRCSCRS